MNDSFSSFINSATSLLILLPKDSTFDEVAAGLSLYLSLASQKQVSIMCPTPMRVEFNSLVGVQKIATVAGDKNLVVVFKNYQATNIEKVSYDIDNGEFKLTVVPKQGFASPTQDQISFSYSGVSGDTIILVGGKQEADFPALQEKGLEKANMVHIGIAALSTQGARNPISLARPGTSVCEVVGNMIREASFPTEADSATNLLAGIVDESKNFRADSVSAETFDLVSFLMKQGGRMGSKTPEISPRQFPIGSIPGQPLMQPAMPGIQTPQPRQQTPFPEENPLEDINPPESWMQTPKIYKGTSVN